MNNAAEYIREKMIPGLQAGISQQNAGGMNPGFDEMMRQKKMSHRTLQQQKIQSLSTLAGGIAHDFNNILGVILAYASRLELEQAGIADQSKNLNAINSAVNQGTELIQQILTFAGKTHAEFKPVSVPHIAGNLFQVLKQTYPAQITFQEIIDWNIPAINADQSQIHKMISNLCKNALDAMPEGGVITVKVHETSRHELMDKYPMLDHDRYVCISVSDNGFGIDTSIQDRIFDPFFTTKEKKKGKGMGLSVVYGIVQSHKGFIDWESESGVGTTFSIYFPALVPFQNKMGSIPIPQVSRPIERETILVVEDEKGLLELARIILETAGYTVLTAKDGLEALDMYAKHQKEIALVFTDIGLPGMTGREVFAKMKERNPDVQVVFTSGIFTDIKAELLKDGAKDFLPKPYKQKEILQKIREVLDANKVQYKTHLSN